MVEDLDPPGPGLPADQRLDLGLVDGGDLAVVVEVADRALLGGQREALPVKTEPLGPRPAASGMKM